MLLPLECYTPNGPKAGIPAARARSAWRTPPRSRSGTTSSSTRPRSPRRCGWRRRRTGSSVDLERARPPGVPRVGRRRGERGPRGGADPLRPAACGSRAPERGDRRCLLPRPPAAGGRQGTTYQVWSVNVSTGARRLQLELANVQGEAEGLAQTPLLGGRLHFLVAPLVAPPTRRPSDRAWGCSTSRREGGPTAD